MDQIRSELRLNPSQDGTDDRLGIIWQKDWVSFGGRRTVQEYPEGCSLFLTNVECEEAERSRVSRSCWFWVSVAP